MNIAYYFSLLIIIFITNSCVISLIYTPIYFEEDEIRHIRQVTSPKIRCEENKLIEFLAERQITSPESIIGIAISDFESTCLATTGTLRKLDDYLKNCTTEPSLYTSLLNGLRAFDRQLCKTEEFYKKYDKYDKCYTDLNKDYETCNGSPDWNESSSDKLCKIYRKIINCFYIKTAKVCGLQAALTLKELMKMVIDSTLVPIECSCGATPRVKDPMPDKYIDVLDSDHSRTENNNGSKIALFTTAFLPILLFFYALIIIIYTE